MKNFKDIKIFLTLILLGLALAYAGFHYFSQQQKEGPLFNNPNISAMPSARPIENFDWDNFISSRQIELKQEFAKIFEVTIMRPVSIFERADITGDSVDEALVSIGSGGAYTDYLTLMQVKIEKPEIANFKQKSGIAGPLNFLVGASVLNGAEIKMLPQQKAVFTSEYSLSGDGQLMDCNVEIYQWNSKTELFEFSDSLSNQERVDYCKNLQDRVGF